VLVKRILRKHGFPPDFQDAACNFAAAGRGGFGRADRRLGLGVAEFSRFVSPYSQRQLLQGARLLMCGIFCRQPFQRQNTRSLEPR